MKKVMLLASENMCDVLRRELDDKYIILPCSDPATGGELLKLKPDVLILDLYLPGTDGVTFLNAHIADLPAVVVTVTRFISDTLLMELDSLDVSSVILIPCSKTYLRDQLSKF